MGERVMGEHVEIDLPLSARYATTARAVAASMAATVGLSIEDIDDLRLGVNEAISVLADVDDEHLDETGGRMHLRFEAGHGEITVAASRSGVAAVAPPVELDVLAQRILRAVVDDFGVDDEGAFLLVKRVAIDVGS